MNTFAKAVFGGAVFAGLMAGMAAPAFAQRDPAYAAARSSGKVGEKMDGYLGIVGAPTAALQDLVDDINIKRKAVYTERARAEKATTEQYAFTAGCLAIARTVAGEKYQAPDGEWHTRTGEDPMRDPRCP
ncbi:Putative uncharacterized protein ydbL, may be related to amine metabolism [Altererythrobacter epoxidivorans]|uniref:DUF1318 domain-containing protein n=1 Tax=Altererythrobacter epoxidivorans TaxID=361183 RepID=A0A0M4MVU2_9SPHN|nr:YdbL family protein [Altererythrobacter epoxidivorans]ALE16725.1 Putative uncharacterized protein ydbL, may be related to amine metabolism [Altererythrobacter epoxidivorans]